MKQGSELRMGISYFFIIGKDRVTGSPVIGIGYKHAMLFSCRT
ncbi:hypothetical protein GCM10008934_00060 [Virgibacillus salarius]